MSERWKERGREREGGSKREREGERGTAGKFLACGRWSSARRRYPGAEMTLYNNSFCFMSWVVCTLRVPRDHHEAAGRGFRLSFPPPAPLSKTSRFDAPFVYDVYEDSFRVMLLMCLWMSLHRPPIVQGFCYSRGGSLDSQEARNAESPALSHLLTSTPINRDLPAGFPECAPTLSLSRFLLNCTSRSTVYIHMDR